MNVKRRFVLTAVITLKDLTSVVVIQAIIYTLININVLVSTYKHTYRENSIIYMQILMNVKIKKSLVVVRDV